MIQPRTKRISYRHIIFFSSLVFINIYSFPVIIRVLVDIFLTIVIIKKTNKRYRPRMNINSLWIISILLALYTFLICATAAKLDLRVLFKPFRFLFILIIFNIITKRMQDYTLKEIVISSFLVFFLHVVAVYIEFIIPQSRTIIYSFLEDFHGSGDDVALRTKGLCSSYDEAGLILCVIQTFIFCLFRETQSKNLLIFLIITCAASLLVSRTTMLVSAVFVTLMLISLFNNEKKFFFLFILPIFALAAYYIYGLVEYYLTVENVADSYYSGSAEYLTTGRMLFLPKTIDGIILGTGKDPIYSDIGYIKIIHMIGIIGLIGITALYLYSYKSIKVFKNVNYNVYLFMSLFLILLFIFNYKLLMLYSRGINDLFFLYLFFLINNKNLVYENYKTRRVL